MPQREQRQQRKGRPAPGGPIRKRNCYFCREKVEEVDYKNINHLRRYVSEKGKIRSRRISGACRRHQRQVAVAVKRPKPGATPMGPPPSADREPEYAEPAFDTRGEE